MDGAGPSIFSPYCSLRTLYFCCASRVNTWTSKAPASRLLSSARPNLRHSSRNRPLTLAIKVKIWRLMCAMRIRIRSWCRRVKLRLMTMYPALPSAVTLRRALTAQTVPISEPMLSPLKTLKQFKKPSEKVSVNRFAPSSPIVIISRALSASRSCSGLSPALNTGSVTISLGR